MHLCLAGPRLLQVSKVAGVARCLIVAPDIKPCPYASTNPLAALEVGGAGQAGRVPPGHLKLLGATMHADLPTISNLAQRWSSFGGQAKRTQTRACSGHLPLPRPAAQGILHRARQAGVPVVFALSRRGIGQVFGRDKSMSIVALMSSQGLDPHWAHVMQEAYKVRAAAAATVPPLPAACMPRLCCLPLLLPARRQACSRRPPRAHPVLQGIRLYQQR